MRRKTEKRFRFTVTWKLAFFALAALALAVSAKDILSLSGLDGGFSRAAVSAAIVIALFVLFILIIRQAIVKPLKSISETWQALAEGEPEKPFAVKSDDEIGDVARSCRLVTARMKEVRELSERIAAGDLTVEVKPVSDHDTLLIAFAKMVENQRNLLEKVKATANSVAEASKQLSNASEQTARATQQLATTAQQIAKGTSEQSISLQETSACVEQLSSAIAQIAQGAEEQARGIEEASAMIKRVSLAMNRVSVSAKAGDEEWQSTAASAAEGARQAHETVEGMNKIKRAMEAVAVRVSDLGARSEEIGKIVATIDDIAAQTNLLALNAAIEAARAGEQGRGFAVVADEVRKLAERSSGATKEIAALVGGIQTRLREAVEAMQVGGKEIEVGYKLAADAGVALDDILARSQNVGKQVVQISKAAQELEGLSSGMVEAIERINKIVEQNAAATQQMAASSGRVSKAVQVTTDVAADTSAASQEVSANVEEMSAQAEEVLAAAQSLTETAEDLDKTLALFKTAGNTGPSRTASRGHAARG
ncbi:MAG: methyl-accepting chemotaxis protein [Dehalococcoidia bacterium]|nr:methyl-accepting chemotaxis protein [Dehalococcoidia bacterium]